MKKYMNKTHGIVAAIISVISFGLLIAAIFSLIKQPESVQLMQPSFAFWIYSMIFAYISLVFYLIDALGSIVRAFKKIHTAFNAILTIVIFTAIPVALHFGGGANTAIWYAYYVFLFTMEIISIIKHQKSTKPLQH